MDHTDLTAVIADAVDHIVPDQARPFVIGDHICVVEVVSDDATAIVTIAPEMRPRHLSMLAYAIGHAIDHHIGPGDGEETDAT